MFNNWAFQRLLRFSIIKALESCVMRVEDVRYRKTTVPSVALLIVYAMVLWVFIAIAIVVLGGLQE